MWSIYEGDGEPFECDTLFRGGRTSEKHLLGEDGTVRCMLVTFNYFANNYFVA